VDGLQCLPGQGEFYALYFFNALDLSLFDEEKIEKQLGNKVIGDDDGGSRLNRHLPEEPYIEGRRSDHLLKVYVHTKSCQRI
jgi:hypothetical protein